MAVVAFQPLGARTFFRLPMSEFHERNIALDDLGDNELEVLKERILEQPDNEQAITLIEQFFISRLHNWDMYNFNRMDPVIKAINNRHQPNIEYLASLACLSYKQFSRIFTDFVGSSPKEFTRIIRFQRALYILQNDPSLDQTELAFRCGFYDQPHLIKEFKIFSGYTPNEYLAEYPAYSDYVTSF